MENQDTRIFPLIEIELDHIRSLLSPLLKGLEITDVKRLDGGLVNTLYRVVLADGCASLCLRVFAAGQLAWEKERTILTRLSGELPVPDVLMAGCSEAGFSHPYLVYRWIEGITLNECRRQMPPAAFMSLAEPLGRLLAGMATLSFADVCDDELKSIRAGSTPMEKLLSANEEMLLRGPARARLGAALADALCYQMVKNGVRLCALDRAFSLVHGDLGGRNIIVLPGDDGNWRITGLIDWETVFFGSALWDIGSLFCYSRRYSETFRQRFEKGYWKAGGSLPEDWWRTARLLDATRSVATLNEERELPVVFAECRDLIEVIVADLR
jgi:aminoglycoside phosphotransferase (APT) family kinase protein